MKLKNYISAGVLLTGLALTGCKESLPDNFGQIDGVYFNNRQTNNMIVDSMTYTFIYEDADSLKAPVRVQLVGRASSQPRTVDIRVSSADAELGTDYLLESEAVLPQGATYFDYIVTLKKSEILKQKQKSILLELHANEHFIIPFTHQVQSGGDTTSVVTYRINFSNQFTAPPAAWDPIFVGTFSQQKFELICDVMGLPRADFNEVGKISQSKWFYIQSRMIDYVRDQQDLKAAGQPYDERAFDEEGEPLKFS